MEGDTGSEGTTMVWTEQTQKQEALVFHAPAVSKDGTTSLPELQPGSPAAQAEPGDVLLLLWCWVQAHAALCSSTGSCVLGGHQEIEILLLGQGQ